MVQALRLYERADSEFTLNGSTGIQSLPKVAWISASRYIAVWTHETLSGGVFSLQVRAQIFEANGTAVGPEFTVDTSGEHQTDAVVAKLAGGGFVIAWEERLSGSDGSGSSIGYQVYGADGLPLGGEGRANSRTLQDQIRPSIAGLEGGGFVITWTDTSDYNDDDSSWSAVRGQIFSASGSFVGSEFLVNSVTDRNQTASSVAALQGGGFAVVWQDESPQDSNHSYVRVDYGSDIAIQVFDSSANKVGGQRVVDDLTPPPAFSSSLMGRVTAQNPVVAVLANGTMAVAWADAIDGFVKTRLLNADGTPAGAVINVATWLGTSNPAPSIVALADGGYAVSWTSSFPEGRDDSGLGVLARVFGPDGSPQGIDFLVNSTTAGDQLSSAMLAFANGGFLVVWQDASTTDLSAQRFGPDEGTILDIALSVPSISKASIENVQAAILSADGALNATFTYDLVNDPTGAFRVEGDRLVVADTALLYGFGAEQATITLRATDPNGNVFEEAVVIPLTAAPVSALYKAGSQVAVTSPTQSIALTPEITALPDGGYFLTWIEFPGSGPYEVRGQFYEADGSAGAQFKVNTVTADIYYEPYPVVLENGNLVVIWTAFAPSRPGAGPMIDVKGQILSPSGEKIGAEFLVNTVTTQLQTRAVPTALADGGFLVTWADNSLVHDNSGSGIKAQFFTSTAAKVGSEFLVNTTTAGTQTSPYAAQLNDGTVVIAWTDSSATGGDTSGTAVRAQLYSAGGVAIGGEFLVNTTTLHSQSAPVVTALSDGRFVVVWGDRSEGTGSTGTWDPADIRAQIFSSTGSRIGGEILVNSETAGFQGHGSLGIAGVAADSAGGFVVTWRTDHPVNAENEPGSIKARLFGPDGSKVGNEFLVNQIATGSQGTPAVAVLSDNDLVFAFWDVTPDPAGVGRAIAMRRFDSAVQSELHFNVLNGTSGDDFLNGSSGRDQIWGFDGTDRLAGQGGDDDLFGGGGFDVLLGEDGDDEIRGGSGDDLMRGGAGVDYFDGGTDEGEWNETAGFGDRVSFFEERATQGVVADLRTGVISNDGFGNVETMVGVESLGADTAFADTLYGDDSFNFLYAGLGDSLYGFGGADVMEVTAAAAVVDGGGGTDTLRVFSHIPGYRPDSNGDGVAEEAPAMTTGYVVNLAAGTLRDGYGNFGTVTGIEDLAGSELGDDLRGDAGNNVVTGGGGNDVLRLYDGGDDTANAGDGNDSLFFIGALTAADVVNGGDGGDTLVLQGPYGALTLTANVTRIENISILAGSNTAFGEPGANRHDYVLTTHDANFAAGVQSRINAGALLAGEDFTFDGSAETDASFVVYGGKGRDTLTGGLGNDIFFFAEDRFASGDTVNGGSGYDGMFLRGNYTIDFNAPGFTGLFTNIDNLTLTSATDQRYARGGGTEFDYNLTLSDALVGAGGQLTVSGALLMATETMIVDASAETNGVLRLFGGKASDTLKGGAMNDLLHGNLGADTLAGGGGADVFQYNNSAESTSASRDHILDFAGGSDRIDLGRIDADTLAAGNQAFSWIGSGAFTGTAGQLRAYQQSGTWFVEGDTNGDGTADLVVAITLQGLTPLSASDFLL
jgi:Ca2+-binding RTX toxin-like protein